MTVIGSLPGGYDFKQHASAVEAISTRVRHFYDSNIQFRIYHGSTNATRPSLRDANRIVDTSSLKHVISIDKSACTALVEPNVPMDALVEATLAEEFLPPIVMEFPGITAGGAFAGIGGESSSFKHGYFDSSVRSIEVVLGNGDIVTASQSENADLFVGAAGTMGTLGVVTLLEISLIPAATHVELTYHTVYSPDEAVAKVTQEAEETTKNDFVDGIMFSSTSGVVCTGRFASVMPPGKKPVRFLRARDNWYYLHAEKQIRQHPFAAPPVDIIPVRDYLFRYDRGAFWMGRYGFCYFPFVPFDRLSRWFLDSLLRTRTMYKAMHESGHYDYFLIQDLGIPCHRAAEFMEFTARGEGIWPLWLCPLRPGNGTQWLKDGVTDFTFYGSKAPTLAVTENGDANGVASKGKEQMIFNIGVWGPMPSKSYENYVAANRAVESKVSSLKGIKWPYSQYYYTEEEFWAMYDRDAYMALREKYHATRLPTMYDKVRPTERSAKRGPPNGSSGVHGWVLQKTWDWWPVSACYGIAKVILGSRSQYLLSREKSKE